MKILRLLIILLCFWSCEQNARPERPADLLSKQEMSDILYDMFLINSAKGSNMKALQENGIDPDTYVLKKHGIDSARFVNSNNYYAYSFEDYSEIMKSIEERVEKEKAYYEKELEKEQKKEAEEKKKRVDSLKKVSPKKSKKPKKD